MKLHAISKIVIISTFLLLNLSSQGQVFTENKGQVLDFYENPHPEVKYYYSDPVASVYFQDTRLVYNFTEKEKIDVALYDDNKARYEEALRVQKATYHRMDMVFHNARSNTNISTGKKTQGVTHYYLNKRNGIRDVQSFESIKYENIYPNIDAIFYHTPNGLKYDMVLKSGADINDILLKFEGAEVRLENKKLIIANGFNELTEEIPLSFINEDSAAKVEVEYVLKKDGTVGFQLKNKINYTTLTIDPILEWGSYFNLTSLDSPLSNIANHLDDDGNYFSYGMTQNTANTYPVVNPGGAFTTTAMGSADAYFAKFNTNRELVWGTYLGGSGYDEIYDGEIITTRGNTLHLVGERITTGAPFTNGGGFYQDNTARNFWARFDKNTGVLQHLTSLSGGYKPSIATSNSGLVVIVNDAYDYNIFPILNRAGAYNQSTHGGSKDMGLLMFNASYNQIWGTFLGGTGNQENFMCAFDNNDILYFVGETGNNSSLLQLPGAYHQNTAGGGIDVWLGKFTSTGQLIWSTLYGGNGSDARRGQQGHGARIVIHPATGELVLAFNTTSNNLPVTNLAGAYNKGVPTNPDFGGASGSFWNYAAYLCKFSTTGALNFSTYYYTQNGGGDLIENIVFGGCNKLYIGSAGFSTKQLTGAVSGYNLIQGTSSSRSGYITMLNSNTFAFEWDSYLNTDVSSEANVAANINHPEFYTTASLYYQNLPVVDPGNGAYYNSTSSNPSGAGIGISQFHPSLPPDISDATICSGASVTLTASGGMGAPYSWYDSPGNPTPLATGSTHTVNPTSTATYYVSSGSGMCASPRVPVTVTVTSVTTGTASIDPATTCTGSSVTLTLAGHSGNLQWQSSTDGGTTWADISEATTTPYIISSVSSSTTYQAVVTDGSCSGNSNTVNVTITPNVTPDVAITGAPSSAICAGTSVTFTANPTNGGTSPSYQWQINGVEVTGETNNTFTTNALNNNDIVTVILTSNAPCPLPTMATASTSAITVDPGVTPSVVITGTPSSTICTGTSVTFTANPTNGGTAPSYQWQINGVDVAGETNDTFTTNSLSDGDVVSVVMVSDYSCASPATVSDNTGTINVDGNVVPTVTIAGIPSGTVCVGSSITFTTSITNGGTNPSYQWQINGVDITGETGAVFTTNSLSDGDIVSVVMVSDHHCASPVTASDNTGTINVGGNVVPTITIAGTPSGTVCIGSSITFTTSITNGGTNPSYQWQINGVDVTGETGTTFTTNSLNNGDVISVTLTSNDPCASITTANDDTGNGGIQIGDNENPVFITCPSNISISSGNVCEIPILWSAPIATDNCSTPTITSTHNPGNLFPVGTTIVTYTATDDAGNQTTCTFNVVVTDEENPVFTNCQGDTTLVITSADCQTVLPSYIPYVEVTDNCPETITYTQLPAAGTVLSTADNSVTVTLTATDASGNQATCTFDVNIIDNVPSSNAGADNIVERCPSGTINLTTLLSNDADNGGIWNSSPVGNNPGNALSGSLLNLQGLSGTYIFLYIAGSCKPDTAIITITVIDAGNISAGTEISGNAFCAKNNPQIDLNSLLLNADSGGIWTTPNTSISSNLNSNGTLNINNLSNGFYTFTYTVTNGVCDSDSTTVSIEINCSESEDFDIPNYVTPNGDGVDDVFVIQGIENYPDNEITIFNRWGNVVYYTANYQNDWNGRSTSKYNIAGDELPTGTYYYVLDTKSTIHGVKTGFIYLER